jgi:hypothetical protein
LREGVGEGLKGRHVGCVIEGLILPRMGAFMARASPQVIVCWKTELHL